MDLNSISQDLKRQSLNIFDPLPDLSIRKVENKVIYPFQEAVTYLFSYTLLQFGFRDRQAALLTDEIIKRFREKLGHIPITRKTILTRKASLCTEQAVITDGGNKILFVPIQKGFYRTRDTIFVAVAIGQMLVGLAESWDELGGNQPNRKEKA